LQGLIAFVSPSCQALLGYRPDELFDRPLSSVLAPECHEDFELHIQATMSIQQTRELQLPELVTTHTFVRKDGTPVVLDGVGQAWQRGRYPYTMPPPPPPPLPPTYRLLSSTYVRVCLYLVRTGEVVEIVFVYRDRSLTDEAASRHAAMMQRAAMLPGGGAGGSSQQNMLWAHQLMQQQQQPSSRGGSGE
jgi:PAS domain S-box-containing protein